MTFAQLFENIFGVYTPIIDSTTGAMITDWGYVGRVAVFIVALYSTFRIIGLLFEGGRRR